MINWGRFKQRLSAAIFPERCIFCGRIIPPMTLCCEACFATVSVVKPPICTYCGREKGDCRCRHKRHHYDRVVSPFYCEEAVRNGILRLKKQPDRIAIRFFAKQMAIAVRREQGAMLPDVVTFVPITKRDRFERGYNQSEQLANALGEQLHVPVVPLLTKLYETKPQKTLRAVFRSGNVFGVFDVRDNYPLMGKTVLLVDDVLTTGCTVNECAKMLKLYGAEHVWCVTASVRSNDKKKAEGLLDESIRLTAKKSLT